MTHARIPLAGVIGSPVAHSRSPGLFRHWLSELGLPGHYIPMDVADDDLENVLQTLPRLGFVGINVTIPHKESVLKFADHLSASAQKIGAANTITFQNGEVFADNTDSYGFMTNLKKGDPDWTANKGPAVVFGAGGAARAILNGLIEAGVSEIRLTNRNKERAEALSDHCGKAVTVYDWVQAGNIIEGAATVVNTTSLGMMGKPEFRIPLDGLEPSMTVTDIVYTPLKTRLLQEAQSAGCVVVDGLGMLLHQAVPGFERWFGAKPQVNETTRSVVLE